MELIKKVDMITWQMTDCLGLLLLTGETDDMTGDYLALVLRDGYIELRYDKRQASDER